jgi:catechol 2,3-dioxygenase-like lactoylglutathione lyase family enzyme
MLENRNAIANIAVRNLPAARKFYEGKLGLKAVGTEGDELVTYRRGDSTLFVYRSDFAGTNKATAVSWAVGDEVDAVVRRLKEKGVAFEHYEMPGMKHDGDVHVGGGMRIAWFKDPDGNVLSVVSG